MDFVIHAATDVAVSVSPVEVFSTSLEGTRRVLELVRTCSVRRLLLVSSGAVYGPLPTGMTHVPEAHLGGPDPLLASSAYAEGKRVSEWLACRAADEGVHVSIGRVFALVGPHLPFDAQFAVGNFIASALLGKDIIIEGDGKSCRSYLYAADMAVWLWAIMLRGRPSQAYNVGAEDAVSISELAHLVRDTLNPHVNVVVKGTAKLGMASSYYVPSTKKAQNELGLSSSIGLQEAIHRTGAWSKSRLGNYSIAQSR